MAENHFLKLMKEKEIENAEPMPDIAICSVCGWIGNISECVKGEDGDWESGYYLIDLCPVCEDGGCIDDYDMSENQLKRWKLWNRKRR